MRNNRFDPNTTLKDVTDLMDEGRFSEAVVLAAVPLPLPENSPIRTVEMAFFCEEGPEADATIAASRATIIDAFEQAKARHAAKEKTVAPVEKTIKPKDDYGYGR
jgi:hypothetical protein